MADTKDFIDSEDDEVMTGFEIKFMDEEADLEDEKEKEDADDIEAQPPEITFEGNMQLVDVRPFTQYIFPSVATYDFQPWDRFYLDGKVDLTQLVFNPKWYEFFDLVYQKNYFGKIEQILSKVIEKKHTILPYPELVFNALNIVSPSKIKVVIIGQDPYFNTNVIGNKSIPQAMGCSFSVPVGTPKPPSLGNIYKNLLDHHHISVIPTTGNLSYWLLQGCLMINAAFTTIQGKANAHKDTWKEFTQDLLKYINSACDNIVFMAWGKDAHILCLNIDPTKHHIITSSHPSPYSYSSEYRGLAYGLDVKTRKQVIYPPFKDTDHFGEANSYLQSVGKSGIIWDLFE